MHAALADGRRWNVYGYRMMGPLVMLVKYEPIQDEGDGRAIANGGKQKEINTARYSSVAESVARCRNHTRIFHFRFSPFALIIRHSARRRMNHLRHHYGSQIECIRYLLICCSQWIRTRPLPSKKKQTQTFIWLLFRWLLGWFPLNNKWMRCSLDNRERNCSSRLRPNSLLNGKNLFFFLDWTSGDLLPSLRTEFLS